MALQLRMGIINNDTQIYGWLKDLKVYSSNFAEIRSSKTSGSKIKYRVRLINNSFIFKDFTTSKS